MSAEIKDVFKIDLILLQKKVVILDLSSIGLASECCYKMPRFAYPTDATDLYRNDFEAPLYPLSNRQLSPAIYLEKKNATTNAWEEIIELTGTTYGYPFGGVGDPNLSYNGLRPYWYGYHVKWLNVYNLQGAGCYRTRLEYTDSVDAQVEIIYSYTYDLKLWNADLANDTVRFTYSIYGGKLGDEGDDAEVIDYGTVKWDRQLRFLGIFGYKDIQEYEEESTRYQSGADVPTSNISVEKYPCDLIGLPHSLHQEIKKTLLLSDKILVDDYTYNLKSYVNKRVKRDSNYEPDYDRWVSFAPVTLQFSQYYRNNRKERC